MLRAVRVRVKKIEGNSEPEFRKFSVDPQITSLEVLYSILAKAFDIKSEFGISYKTINPTTSKEEYLVVLSDWDLDSAFLRANNTAVLNNSEPCLNLCIEVKPFSEAPDWESANSSITTSTLAVLAGGMNNMNIQQSIGAGQKYVQTKLPGFLNQVEKTFSMVSKAFTFVEDTPNTAPPRPPLSDNEFRYYCDSVGQIIHQNELRKVIYQGGIDPSLRRVVWKHILNVYPAGLTGKERMDYIKKKSAEYYNLREIWRTAVQGGNIVGELAYVTSMVRKDVLRTDRLHPFYAGSDDNQNIGALFNVLTTYALNHPSVSYCQGMSDIASPLLVIMCDEAQAYICFCAIMQRLKSNFMIDGIAMTQKFSHLSDGIKYYDLEFYNYLKLHQADDLLFCYRWLLLEMKREFAFEDALRMLEVLWSSLPPNPPEKELKLFEKEFEPPAESPKSPTNLLRTENPYTKLCALRRQNSAASISSAQNKLDSTKRMNQSLDENFNRDKTANLKKMHQSLDEKNLLIRQNNVSSSGEPEKLENPEELVETSKSVESIADKSSDKEEKNPFIYTDSSEDIPSPLDDAPDEVSLKSADDGAEKKSGGHFNDLKERIAAGKRGLLSTLEKLETDYDPLNIPTADVKPKLVKNFNEFLNFAAMKTDEKPEEIDNKNKKKAVEASPDDSEEYFPMTTSMTRDLKIELENLNRHVFGQNYHQQQFNNLRSETPEGNLEKSPTAQKPNSNISYFQLNNQSASLDAIEIDNNAENPPSKVKLRRDHDLNDDPSKRISTSSMNDQIFVWQNPLHQFGSSENVLSKDTEFESNYS